MAKQRQPVDKFGRRLPLGPRPENLPTHDSMGRKLPRIFKTATGAMSKKTHTPKGKEIRVSVQDGRLKPTLTTFRDMKQAHQFINASNATHHINRRVELEFGNGQKQRLKLGQTVKP